LVQLIIVIVVVVVIVHNIEGIIMRVLKTVSKITLDIVDDSSHVLKRAQKDVDYLNWSMAEFSSVQLRRCVRSLTTN